MRKLVLFISIIGRRFGDFCFFFTSWSTVWLLKKQAGLLQTPDSRFQSDLHDSCSAPVHFISSIIASWYTIIAEYCTLNWIIVKLSNFAWSWESCLKNSVCIKHRLKSCAFCWRHLHFIYRASSVTFFLRVRLLCVRAFWVLQLSDYCTFVCD